MSRMNPRTIFTRAAVCVAASAAALLAGCAPHADDGAEGDVETVVAVKTGTIETGTLHGYVQAYGEVAPDPGGANGPAARLLVTAPASGRIAKVVCAEGQKVNAGDTLFEMDSVVAEGAAKEARATLALARENLARQEKLLEIKAAPEKAVEEARRQVAAAQAALDGAEYGLRLATVRAAHSGTVVRVAATEGASVNPADVLAEIWDLDRLLVLARVPASEAAQLAVGQKALLSSGGGASEGEGMLEFIDPQVDPATGTVGIRVAPSSPGMFRCGGFVAVRVVCTEHAGCLTVPDGSVVPSSGTETAIAVVEGDRAVFHPVAVGLKEAGRIEIAGEGLRAGLTVVVSGSYGMPDNTRIRIVEP